MGYGLGVVQFILLGLFASYEANRGWIALIHSKFKTVMLKSSVNANLFPVILDPIMATAVLFDGLSFVTIWQGVTILTQGFLIFSIMYSGFFLFSESEFYTPADPFQKTVNVYNLSKKLQAYKASTFRNLEVETSC